MTVKHHAVRGLARMGYKPATKGLTKLLTDPSGGIRVNTIDALVALNAKSASSALKKCLNDPQWYVRQHASLACEKLRITTAIPALQKLAANDPRKAVKTAATKAIAALKSKPETKSNARATGSKRVARTGSGRNK